MNYILTFAAGVLIGAWAFWTAEMYRDLDALTSPPPAPTVFPISPPRAWEISPDGIREIKPSPRQALPQPPDGFPFEPAVQIDGRTDHL